MKLPERFSTAIRISRDLSENYTLAIAVINVFGELVDYFDPVASLPPAARILTFGKNIPETEGFTEYCRTELQLVLPIIAIPCLHLKSVPEWLGEVWWAIQDIREQQPDYSRYIRFYPGPDHSTWFKMVWELRRHGVYDELGGNRIRRLLGLFSDNPVIRRKASISMDKYGPGSWSLVNHKLHDPDPGVAAEAQKALSRMAAKNHTPSF